MKTRNSQQKSEFDIIVVGAGMVGLTSALGAARQGLNVAMVEGQSPTLSPWHEQFDIRVSAINLASQNVFRHLHAWPTMRELGVYAYERMHVWEDANSAEIHFESAQVGQANLGHIIENRVMVQALWQQAESLSNVRFFCPAQTRHIDRFDDKVVLDLGDQRIAGQLLIGADGSNSWVRSQMGVANRQGDYQQSAVVATVKLEQPHQNCAWQIFRQNGPLALLPMRENHCSIVWSTSKEEAAQLLTVDDNDFCQKLQSALNHRFGEMQLHGLRQAFPLRYRHSSQYVQTRLALVGDAAHTIHPLAGQGVNLGIMDSACLLDVLRQAVQSKRDLGDYAVLRQYERWRRGSNSVMLNSMTGINQLYKVTSPWLVQLRQLGLAAVDAWHPVKRFFIIQAMGLQNDLPLLAQR